MLGIAGVVAFGNKAVERLFRDVSYLLYGVYALFIVLALWTFGDRVPGRLRGASANLRLGAQRAHLRRLQHHRRGGDPAGAAPPDRATATRSSRACIAGPLTMLPALLFFIPMVAFYPDVQDATLPSDFLLQRIGLPCVPLAVPGDDLLGAARERDERRPCDQRAHRPRLAGAHAARRCRTARGWRSRLVAARRVHVPRRAASASLR